MLVVVIIAIGRIGIDRGNRDGRFGFALAQRRWRRQADIGGIADGETRARLVGLLQLASVESVTGVLD